ncbi:hypothetical protein [Hymenobacter terrestris]|uniref:DUF3035 domain-containing protein n=1 Tax=Hymenobacter terrestris TaxID=2748310 RepID=A0ABX2Q1W0_9BACT|nr:hypothetical protein [Hymenobacter terrestris]NVO84001.1 hypothetical protein [Hymenobacter terrestris]
MSKQLAISAFALAALALGGCSAEPSDWRPDQKVSLDLVEPGTRSSGLGNYDNQHAAGEHESGQTGLVSEEPSNSGGAAGVLSETERVSAEKARSVNDPAAPLTRNKESVRSVKKPSDTTATKALDGPMQ